MIQAKSMKRIAVIEENGFGVFNEQGDVFSKFKQRYEKSYEFVRVTKSNIENFFSDYKQNVLKYDALIILDSEGVSEKLSMVKDSIEQFVQLGKGILIFAQNSSEDDQFFLPERYQYKLQEVKKNSKLVFDERLDFDANAYILDFPHQIDVHLAFEANLAFSIEPVSTAYYFRVLGNDDSTGIVVSTSINNERIVITGLYPDGFIENEKVLDNIFSYVVEGIPRIAFVKKDGEMDAGFKYLKDEVTALNFGSYVYEQKSQLTRSRLKKYHDIYIFSKVYSENEALEIFDKFRKNKTIRCFYYKTINNDLFLTEITNKKTIDHQKLDLYSLILYTYQSGYWNHSFHQTVRIIEGLSQLQMPFHQFVYGILTEISKYMIDDSYEGKIIETCDLFKLQTIILNEDKYPSIDKQRERTKTWLLSAYTKADYHQRKVIIKAFIEHDDVDLLVDMHYEGDKEKMSRYIEQAEMKENFEDATELMIASHLRFYADVTYAFNNLGKQFAKLAVKAAQALLDKQDMNGYWSQNLEETAQILDILYVSDTNLLNAAYKEKMSQAMELSILMIKKAYYAKGHEKNLMFALSVVKVLNHYDHVQNAHTVDTLHNEADSLFRYKTIDFLIKSLEEVILVNAGDREELERLRKIEEKYFSNKVRVSTISSLTSILFLLLISYWIFLALEDTQVFKTIMSQSLMWVPIAIGMLVTPTVAFISKKMVGRQYKKQQNDQ